MRTIKNSISYPFRFVIFLWLIFLFEFIFSYHLSVFGIVPRTTFGLIGIFTAPLLHGSFLHLVSNSIPLLMLGTSLYLFYNTIAARIFFNCYLITGILVWIIARPSVHIGASGLVYGIAFFLFFIGIFRRDFKSILISLVTAFFYGGIIYGVFPTELGISWESHLMGACVGIFSAFKYRNIAKG